MAENLNLINVKQFATYCGVTVPTVWNWINTQKITPSTRVGKSAAFTKEQIATVYKTYLNGSASSKPFIILVGKTKQTENNIVKALSEKEMLKFDYVSGENPINTYLTNKFDQLVTEDTELNPNCIGELLSKFIAEYVPTLISMVSTLVVKDANNLSDITLGELFALATGVYDADKETDFDARIKDTTKATYASLNDKFYTFYLDLAKDYALVDLCKDLDIRSMLINSKTSEVIPTLLNEMEHYEITIRPENKKAWAIQEKYGKQKLINDFVDGLHIIGANGYFTIANITSADQVNDLTATLMKTIFVNNSDYNEVILIKDENSDIDLANIETLIENIPQPVESLKNTIISCVEDKNTQI